MTTYRQAPMSSREAAEAAIDAAKERRLRDIPIEIRAEQLAAQGVPAWVAMEAAVEEARLRRK